MEKSIWHKSAESMLAIERMELERLSKTAPSEALLGIIIKISKLEREVAAMDKEHYRAVDKKHRTINEKIEDNLYVITDGKQYLSVDWNIADTIDGIEMVDDINKAAIFNEKTVEHYFKELKDSITPKKLFYTKIVKITRFEYSDEI